MIIIGDIHGCYKTLMKLLDKCPKDREICFVGDLIDRGPESIKVVDFVMENEHLCVLGNHEHMMLDFYDDKSKYGEVAWMMAGGLSSLQEYDGKDETRDKHIEWMKSLPWFLDFSDYSKLVDKNNRSLFVSHSSVNKELNESIEDLSILWTRKYPPQDETKFHVFGHTPQDEILQGEYYANIDTGACFENHMTALLFPEMEVITQKYSE